jgi:transaldolase
MQFTRTVEQMPPDAVQQEIDAKVDVDAMRDVLMKEGVDKFVKPQRALLSLVADKRKQLSPAS